MLCIFEKYIGVSRKSVPRVGNKKTIMNKSYCNMYSILLLTSCCLFYGCNNKSKNNNNSINATSKLDSINNENHVIEERRTPDSYIGKWKSSTRNPTKYLAIFKTNNNLNAIDIEEGTGIYSQEGVLDTINQYYKCSGIYKDIFNNKWEGSDYKNIIVLNNLNGLWREFYSNNPGSDTLMEIFHRRRTSSYDGHAFWDLSPGGIWLRIKGEEISESILNIDASIIKLGGRVQVQPGKTAYFYSEANENSRTNDYLDDKSFNNMEVQNKKGDFIFTTLNGYKGMSVKDGWLRIKDLTFSNLENNYIRVKSQ